MEEKKKIRTKRYRQENGMKDIEICVLLEKSSLGTVCFTFCGIDDVISRFR